MIPPTLAHLLAEARQRLAAGGIGEAAGDARHLVAGLLDLTPTDLITQSDRPVSPEEWAKVAEAVRRRLEREPVHRILGRRQFYGLDLSLSRETLEPRPDTEILVEEAMSFLKNKPGARFVDFGTGTGAISLALLSVCPGVTGVGVDLSDDALATALANAERLGLADRFTTIKSNWGAAVRDSFELVVSNPPYIASPVIDQLEPEVRGFDPLLALDGGLDGLDAYRVLASESVRLLKPEGIVALEIGHDQKESVTALFEQAGFTRIRAVKDLGGHDRVLVFTRA